MTHIAEAKMMLEAAEKAAHSQPLRVGYLTLAKDAITTELNKARKGESASADANGQTALEDFAQPTGTEVTVDGNGMVLTDADRAVDDEDDEPTTDPLADLPTEAEYDAALNAHKTHLADLDAGIYAENCVYCQAIKLTRAPEHDRPDTSDVIPNIGDSRGTPDGGGMQAVPG